MSGINASWTKGSSDTPATLIGVEPPATLCSDIFFLLHQLRTCVLDLKFSDLILLILPD